MHNIQDRYDAADEVPLLSRNFINASLSSLINCISDAILITDHHGRVIYANHSAAARFGYHTNCLAGKQLTSLLPASISACVQEKLEWFSRSAKATFYINTTENALPRNYVDHIYNIRIFLTKAYSDDRLLITVLFPNANARECKISSSGNLPASSTKESLPHVIHGLCHDFNNLLTGIHGYASLALEETSLTPAVTNYILQAEKGCERAIELLRQIQATTSEPTSLGSSVDLAEIAQEVIDFSQSMLPDNCTLRLNNQSASALVRGDPALLHEAILNLVKNAWQSLSGKIGEVTIFIYAASSKGDNENTIPYSSNTSAKRQWAVLEVSDTGIGILPDNLGSIFEPFHTTRSSSGGTGLGLYMVNRIIAAHQGNVSIASTQGKGSVFRIILPLFSEFNSSP